MAKRRSSVRPIRSERVSLRLPRFLAKSLRALARKEAMPLNFVIVAILNDDAYARKLQAHAAKTDRPA